MSWGCGFLQLPTLEEGYTLLGVILLSDLETRGTEGRRETMAI